MIFFIGMFLSCGNSDQQINDILGTKNGPDEISEGVTLFFSDKGIVQMKLEAPILNRYYTQNIMECPNGMIVYFYDSIGIQESRIKALYGKLYSEEQYLLLKDSVELTSIDGKKLETPLLHIDFKFDSIYTSEKVKITTLDGQIKGKGMYTNTQFTKYQIDSVGDSFYNYKEVANEDE